METKRASMVFNNFTKIKYFLNYSNNSLTRNQKIRL